MKGGRNCMRRILCAGLAAIAWMLCGKYATAAHVVDEDARSDRMEVVASEAVKARQMARSWRTQANDARLRCTRFNIDCGMDMVYEALSREAEAKAERRLAEFEACVQKLPNCGHPERFQNPGTQDPRASGCRKTAQAALQAIEAAKRQSGLSEGDLAMLEAREASLGIRLAGCSSEDPTQAVTVSPDQIFEP